MYRFFKFLGIDAYLQVNVSLDQFAFTGELTFGCNSESRKEHNDYQDFRKVDLVGIHCAVVEVRSWSCCKSATSRRDLYL